MNGKGGKTPGAYAEAERREPSELSEAAERPLSTEPVETSEEAQNEAHQDIIEHDLVNDPEMLSAAHASVTSILEKGTGKFFRGYPVDESFLCWVGGAYGQETLEELAQALAEGRMETSLWYELTGSSMHVLWLEYCREHNYASYLYSDVVWKEVSDPEQITIDFVGDINLDDRWYTMKTAESLGGVSECLSHDVQQELQSADLTVVNNEFTYTTSDDALEDKSYTFKAAPENVKYLELFGTDLVSLANNHTYDYGEQGLLDTLDTLKDAGVMYSGAGRNLAEASAVRYFVAGGRKIAIVSTTEIERFYHFTREAQEGEPGVLKAQQEKELLAAIRRARACSDYVFVYVHWGGEGNVVYDSGQSALAKTYVEAGVDAVIGGHPHRLQGVTFMDDVPVAYSLGNFWFSSGTLYTTIAQLQIDGDGGLTLRFLPCVQKAGKTYMLDSEEELKEFYHYLADISKNVGIDESGCFYPYRDVDGPGESPYAYTSGRRYGMHPGDKDMEGRAIDIVGNLE
ncbi:MAG: CapA family protein [Blautia sp.]|nr:CapA family protein [Blautia sp.]